MPGFAALVTLPTLEEKLKRRSGACLKDRFISRIEIVDER